MGPVGAPSPWYRTKLPTTTSAATTPIAAPEVTGSRPVAPDPAAVHDRQTAGASHAAHKGEDTFALHELLDHALGLGRVVLVVPDEVFDLAAVDPAFIVDDLENDIASPGH